MNERSVSFLHSYIGSKRKEQIKLIHYFKEPEP